VFSLSFGDVGQRALEALAIGAMPTISRLAVAGPTQLDHGWLSAACHLVVLSAAGTREREAVDSATAFLKDIEQAAVGVKGSRTGFFPGRAQRSKKCPSSSSWKCRRALSSPAP
jgi:hypothetical protein